MRLLRVVEIHNNIIITNERNDLFDGLTRSHRTGTVSGGRRRGATGERLSSGSNDRHVDNFRKTLVLRYFFYDWFYRAKNKNTRVEYFRRRFRAS